MKITRRQLRKIIKESIYGGGKIKPGPVNPMTKISTGGGTSVNRIPNEFRDNLDILASNTDTEESADSLAGQVQTPDLVFPFEGEPYKEKASKDSYKDELKKHHLSNPNLLILPIKKEINKYTPNLERILDEKIGGSIKSKSQLSYDWSNSHDGVVTTVNSKVIDLDNMTLLASEALFGSDSKKYQELKKLVNHDLYGYIVGGNAGAQTNYAGVTRSECGLIVYAMHYSFPAYIAYKAIETGAQANFGAEWIGASSCNIGYSEPGEQQEIEFYNHNKIGPGIFNLAKIFNNITIEGEKILNNARLTLK